MDQLCSTPKCLELNQKLLQEVLALRKEISGNLLKADRILGLLGGLTQSPVVPVVNDEEEHEVSPNAIEIMKNQRRRSRAAVADPDTLTSEPFLSKRMSLSVTPPSRRTSNIATESGPRKRTLSLTQDQSIMGSTLQSFQTSYLLKKSNNEVKTSGGTLPTLMELDQKDGPIPKIVEPHVKEPLPHPLAKAFDHDSEEGSEDSKQQTTTKSPMSPKSILHKSNTFDFLQTQFNQSPKSITGNNLPMSPPMNPPFTKPLPKKRPTKSVTSNYASVDINSESDEDSDIGSREIGMAKYSQSSLATTELPRYMFASSLRLGSMAALNDTMAGPPLKPLLPKSVLTRNNTGNFSQIKRDRVDKPVSEFDPQNKNTAAIQAERSRRTSLAHSVINVHGIHRPSFLHYSINRKQSVAPSQSQSMFAPSFKPSNPMGTQFSSSVQKSIMSLVLQKDEAIQLTLYQRLMCVIILPAYDNKGRKLTTDQFGEADFNAIRFMVNGFHPKSYLITLWDFLVSVAYCTILWLIPFLTSYVNQLSSSFVDQCSIWFTVLFGIDSLIFLIAPQPAIVNSMGSFREYEALRPPLKDWMSDWLRHHFFLEVISLIPFSYIFRGVDNFVFLFWFRFLRFHRLPEKMTRCAFFVQLKFSLESRIGMGFCKVIPIAILIFYFIHLNACAMFLTGVSGGFLGWDSAFPEFNASEIYKTYTWTIFQSVGNIFPMSFKPQTALEQAFAILFIVIGAVLYAAFVGYVSSAAMSINPSGRLYNQKMDELLDYIKFKNLPEETKDRLVSYYETKYRGKFFEEDSLLSDMNESLREVLWLLMFDLGFAQVYLQEILLQNTHALIEKVPFFQRNEQDGRDEIFIRRIASVLHAQFFIPGDFIIKQGDSGNEMYFILSGKVNVYVNGIKVVSLYEGAYIGEVALLTNRLRTATVLAVLPCILYKLSKSDFQKIINEFQDMKSRISILAREAEKMVRQNEEFKVELK